MTINSASDAGSDNPRFFFSCDWGTSSFRLKLVDGVARTVVGEVRNDEGVGSVQARIGQACGPDREQAFAAILQRQVATLASRHSLPPGSVTVVVSGMASSSVGWRNIPYARVPFPIDGSRIRWDLLTVPAAERAPGLSVVLISGLATGDDMMRGEETEIIGLLAGHREGNCLLVLPGTHSKHVRVCDGLITDIRTHLTGELLELLATRSLLRTSVDWPPDAAGPGASPAAHAAFAAGVKAAREGSLGRGFFQVRVRALLHQAPSADNIWFLSGLLVGAELRDLLAWRPSVPILLAAAERFRAVYELAFAQLGGDARLQVIDAARIDRAVIQTHALLWQRLQVQTTP